VLAAHREERKRLLVVLGGLFKLLLLHHDIRQPLMDLSELLRFACGYARRRMVSLPTPRQRAESKRHGEVGQHGGSRFLCWRVPHVATTCDAPAMLENMTREVSSICQASSMSPPSSPSAVVAGGSPASARAGKLSCRDNERLNIDEPKFHTRYRGEVLT
jgi:hypothetical protein